MKFTGIQQYTQIDYPGHIACVVFTPGCNLRCPFCYNPESVLPELLKQQTSNLIDASAVLNFLRTRRGLLDGVSICGGEPTLQADLFAFAQQVKDLGFLVKLDTNGRDVAVVERMLDAGVLDYVAVDIKHALNQYDKACGVQLQSDYWDNYHRLLALLQTGVVPYEYRTTVIKGVHTEEVIEEIACYIEGVDTYYLQNYRPGFTLDPEFSGEAFSVEELRALQERASHYVGTCLLRT